MYPSSLIIIPEPFAVAVVEERLKIELTEYSTLIATIDGCTFFATPTAVSEYPWSEISCVFKLVELFSLELLSLLEESVTTSFSKNACLILGTFTQSPTVRAAPSTPHTKGSITTLPNPAPFVFSF